MLDDVRRDDEVDTLVAQRQGGAVEGAEAQPARRGVLGRRGTNGLGAVVGADDQPVGSGEPTRLVADAAADVDGDARAQPREYLAITGVVEREQRVGGCSLHWAFARQLHDLPAPSPRLLRRSSVQRSDT